MSLSTWLMALPQFLILFPSAASCYLPIPNQRKYSFLKTAALCTAVLLPCSFLGAWLQVALSINIGWIFVPFLIFFFFLYCRTVTLDRSKALAVYVGVCAIETFPAQFSYVFDAYLHPSSGAAFFSTEAALFQLFLSFLLLAAFIYPARHQFAWMLEHVSFSRLYYTTLPISSLFLLFNIAATPVSYRTLYAGRIFHLFPIMEFCAMLLLIAIYILFYQGAIVILKHTDLEKRSQLLEIQAHQYQTLQEHMRQTARLRHDFRHSIHLLTSLARQNDLENIRIYLEKYESSLSDGTPVHYCSNMVLNALFGYYHELAEQAEITTDWRITLPEPLTISELDMASLLGNLIDNAISGCQSRSEGKRYFSLTTEIRPGGSLYIVSTNSFDGHVKKGKDGYRSTKHSGKGTGLDSIVAITEKYHGTARITNDEKEFFVDVIMKL